MPKASCQLIYPSFTQTSMQYHNTDFSHLKSTSSTIPCSRKYFLQELWPDSQPANSETRTQQILTRMLKGTESSQYMKRKALSSPSRSPKMNYLNHCPPFYLLYPIFLSIRIFPFQYSFYHHNFFQHKIAPFTCTFSDLQGPPPNRSSQYWQTLIFRQA